jgi:hypothetical protein
VPDLLLSGRGLATAHSCHPLRSWASMGRCRAGTSLCVSERGPDRLSAGQKYAIEFGCPCANRQSRVRAYLLIIREALHSTHDGALMSSICSGADGTLRIACACFLKKLTSLRKFNKKTALLDNSGLEIQICLMKKQYFFIRRVIAILLTLIVKICILLHHLNGTVLAVGDGHGETLPRYSRFRRKGLSEAFTTDPTTRALNVKDTLFQHSFYHEL